MTFTDLIYILIGVSAVGTAIAELFARSHLKRNGEYFARKPDTTTILEVDLETLPTLEKRTRFAVNGAGERGDEPPASWDDTMRVLVAGGSAAECYLLDQKLLLQLPREKNNFLRGS